MTADRLATLERRLKPLLVEVEGQYPRPWMLGSLNPTDAQIFIVGYQWAKRYAAARVSHEQYLASHWNRDLCRKLYDDVTVGEASGTRREQDTLADKLKEIAGVLETNVICCSRPDAGKLSRASVEHGVKIFKTLLDVIRPRVVLMYGTKTLKKAEPIGFQNLMIPDLRSPDPIGPTSITVAPMGESFEVKVITIRSLGQPDFNKWKASWPRVRDRVIELVRTICQ